MVFKCCVREILSTFKNESDCEELVMNCRIVYCNCSEIKSDSHQEVICVRSVALSGKIIPCQMSKMP